MKMNKLLTIVVFLLSFASMEANAQTVNPMLSTEYRQTAPYNNSCPDNAAAGCGPVAVAQILTKYRQPFHGYGSVSYTSGASGYAINVNFENITFDWDNIKDSYHASYTEPEAKAVADLVFACGAAMRASYGSSTSIGNYARMLYGLHHNLHMSEDARYLHRQYYSTAEWIEMLDGQLRAGHPVFYRGTWFFDGGRSNHMFVIDGLDAEGKYHVNFGHGGSGDKFTDINVLNQSGTNPGGRGVCYNALQAMVINCYPTPEHNSYPLQRCISEEPVILNGDESLRETTVELGEIFTLSCRLRNYCLTSATVNYGWGLVKDGRLIDILRQRSYGLSAGNQFVSARHLDFALPVDLEDGNYLLCLYSKSDIEPEWAKVWEDAPTDVKVEVNSGMATITVPDNHEGNPQMYLARDIKEVDNLFFKTVPGRVFELDIVNPSTNNFLDSIQIEIVADGIEYTYKTYQPVFSQSQTVYHVLVPQTAVDLEGKTITDVNAFYYSSERGGYEVMRTTKPTGVGSTEAVTQAGNIAVYTINGMLIKCIDAKNVATTYADFLKSLPHGIYVVKEGKKVRKIVL